MSRSFIMGGLTGTALSIVGLASVSLMTSPTLYSSEPSSKVTAESTPDVEPAMVPPTGTTAGPEASELATPQGTDQIEPLIIDVPEGSEFAKPTSLAETAFPSVDQAPSATVDNEGAVPAAEPAPALNETVAAAAPESTAIAPTDKALSSDITASVDAPPVEPNVEGAAPDLAKPTSLPVAEPAESSDGLLADASGAGHQGGLPTVTATDVPEVSTEAAPEVAKTDDNDAVSALSPVPEAESPAPTDTPAVETVPKPAAKEGTAEKSKPRVITLNPTPEPADPANSTPDATTPGTKPTPLPQTVPGVKIMRLPATTPSAPVAPTDPEPAAAKPPREAFAANWSNPDKKPVLAIVILDLGLAGGGLDPAALDSLPFPVTFALDPEQEGVAAVAAAHRAAGKEVAILAGDLPKGATDADFEVAYQSYVSMLAESVALMGLPDADFQKSNLAAQHVAALLSADGRGLITFDKGLNPGRRAAEKAGVAVASVDRLFDGTSTSIGTLMRELDRAAFTAGQSGSYVIALPSTPEAITTLMAWAAGPATAHVALGPVTAVMTGGK